MIIVKKSSGNHKRRWAHVEVVRHIEQIKEAGRGFDLPKVRTAGFAHVKRFRDSNRLPNVLGASEKSKVPVRAPIVSAGSNSVSLPNLRPANNLVNPNWGAVM